MHITAFIQNVDYSYMDMIYKYDIPVGFPPGITSPREDCRSRA